MEDTQLLKQKYLGKAKTQEESLKRVLIFRILEAIEYTSTSKQSTYGGDLLESLFRRAYKEHGLDKDTAIKLALGVRQEVSA